MKNKFPDRQYIDLFAGPGRCVLSDGSSEFNGTPLEVLATPQRFLHYHFVEAGPEEFSALKTRARLSNRFESIAWYPEDANDAAAMIRQSLSEDTLGLAVIDPTGLHFHFDSLRRLVSDRKVDLIYLFPDGMDINRNLERYLDGNQLDLVLGTSTWKNTIQSMLNGNNAGTNSEATKIIVKTFMTQLQGIGYPYVSTGDQIRFRNSKSANLYYLVFASRHTKGHEFWSKIQVIDPRGQRKIDFSHQA